MSFVTRLVPALLAGSLLFGLEGQEKVWAAPAPQSAGRAEVQVDLFRGLADIFSRGMDTLTHRLNQEGYSARVYSTNQWPTAAERIAARDGDAKNRRCRGTGSHQEGQGNQKDTGEKRVATELNWDKIVAAADAPQRTYRRGCNDNRVHRQRGDARSFGAGRKHPRWSTTLGQSIPEFAVAIAEDHRDADTAVELSIFPAAMFSIANAT